MTASNWTAESHLGDSPFLKRVYAASSAAESKEIYDEWAQQYDKDLEAEDYAFPSLAAEALVDALDRDDDTTPLKKLSILDAGCGTGMVGTQLARFGASDITGLDISTNMLEIARKTGVYGALEEADLSKTLKQADDSIDAVVCVGTLTRGHVGPKPVLEEFERIVKNEGLIVATVLDDIWESAGFKAEIERLRVAGRIQVLRSDEIGVRRSSSKGGRLLVLKKM
jgi:predicted TPR repeat methyltransferase